MGDGKITIIPTSNPASPLCSFPYSRVLAINVSRGRDPLWSLPQGPAPVARAGGTLSRIGIQVTRDWIALRTSTEEQFVSMRFDESAVEACPPRARGANRASVAVHRIAQREGLTLL